MTPEKILQTGKDALDIHLAEIKRLRDRMDNRFAEAVSLIGKSKGKVILVGIGKSAHVGRKIVATFNSTGTPAQFLHASEAIHGDLGLIQKRDVVLCLSYSGNSPEIVHLLPFLKKYSSVLIAMTGNSKSKLAKEADLVLDIFVEKEACPIRLAPTSSTSVQMALGDALAISLMKLKKFSDADFAKFHPGGSLGKNLTATVSQFLSQNKPQVDLSSGIREVIISVSASQHGITVVTDKSKIVGVITDGDLRRMLMKNEDIKDILASDVMSRNPKLIEKGSLAKEAMKILKENNIGQLIVTDQGRYVGIINLHRLLEEGIV
ncbi:MAG: KpsF/GutQ family sugar-phosphate isomerase [Bergeyella sp.]|nr:KpsF/GutQ family sugar-phosphate isomerase [Bergeyella sp.]